ncbi:hypothetical protein FRC14_002431 [Serendipita sp. 396]|nr:hypothetical protein FRC14_002431 [Serendipita sp. 396]KAG8800243.1 hypothetical protein FRC16_003336 [Serendipita sp. 398]KAG8868356.1 hypothetical protein FRC20_003566 [Serendipita sp. 405]
MPIANAYKEACQTIINKLNAEVTSTKPRRHLSSQFLNLPDPTVYGDYYSVITEPRSINGVQEKLQKNRYRNILDVLNDLYLVFANALHYNEASSQIAKDATVLQEMFLKLWKDDPYLPNAQPTKQPGRKPGFRTAPLPRMSSFATPMRHVTSSIQPSYSTALATVQLKPLGKPPAPIIAPRLQPLKKGKRRRIVHKSADSASDAKADGHKPRREESPAFSEVDFKIIDEDGDLDVPPTHIASEFEADTVIERLESTLPLWNPWEDSKISQEGWMIDLNGTALQEKMEAVVSVIKTYQTASEQRPILALEDIPTQADSTTTCNELLAWASVTTRVSQRQYTTARTFEKDLFRLFEKARRFYKPATANYGAVLTCQRLVNLLTSPSWRPSLRVSLTMSSTLGPRNAQPRKRLVNGAVVENPNGIICYDVVSHGRTVIDYISFKGVMYRTGDFVHLTNPEDMSRPLIGQIWTCWSLGSATSFTVCWYLRPEQTVHAPDHPFYENEVVKTGIYVDYTPEDIIEKVCVQFSPHYFTGRPRPPYWYLSWPLYMCEQRYDDRTRTFHRISLPERCFPPSCRQSEEKAPSNPVMHAMLMRNSKLDAIQPIYPFERLTFPLRKSGPNAGPRRATSSGPTSFTIGPSDSKDHLVGPSNLGGFDFGRGRPKRMAAVKAASAVGPSGPGAPNNASTGGSAPVLPNISPGDRSVVSAAGGVMITAANVEKLPPDTTQFFDRDPITNEMLWFSGAPLDVAKAPKLQYSLDYLYGMALEKKRKATGDAEGAPLSKRPGIVVQPSAGAVWQEVNRTTPR